jgi:hypothetical protein
MARHLRNADMARAASHAGPKLSDLVGRPALAERYAAFGCSTVYRIAMPDAEMTPIAQSTQMMFTAARGRA